MLDCRGPKFSSRNTFRGTGLLSEILELSVLFVMHLETPFYLRVEDLRSRELDLWLFYL
jgi:hypothetical protein